MGLKETTEELKSQLEEAKKLEDTALEQPEEKPAEEVKEEIPEEPKPEEKPAEEVKKTPAEYAEERRQKKAAKLAEESQARLAEANARIQALESKVPTDEAPNREENPQEYLEWKLKKTEEKLAKVVDVTEKISQQKQRETLISQAEQEIQTYESDVRRQYPDYDQAKNYYANMLAGAIRIADPDISNQALVKQVTDRMMLRASKLLNAGHDNPIEAMYQESLRMGYKPVANESAAEEIKPDMEKVARNRSRNAGTAAAQGDGGRGELTPKVAATMTNAEFAKLKPAEKEKLFKQLSMGA